MKDSPGAPQSGSPVLRNSDQLIASRVHTIVVLAAVAAWAYGASLAVARLNSQLHPHRVRLYLFSIGEEWLMFALILLILVVVLLIFGIAGRLEKHLLRWD